MKSRSRLLPAYLDGDRATLDFYIYTIQFQSYRNREKNHLQISIKVEN